MSTLEEKATELYALTMFLLYERENETELRIAFAATVQERHHTFHDKDENVTTEFAECPNEVCCKALAILQQARKPRIELNDFGIELIKKYALRLQKADRKCIAFLEEKSLIEQPEIQQGVTILE